MRQSSFIAIIFTGFAAGVAQILILRESLVLFYGNELSTGLVLACWLSWTAIGSAVGGKWGIKFGSDRWPLCWGLLSLAVLIPLTLLWIRAARLVWSVPLGETVSPALMLLISLSSTCCFCLLSGFMFALCWATHLKKGCLSDTSPIRIYLGEALGAAAGGLFFYFVLLPYASTLLGACITSIILAAFALILLKPEWQAFRFKPTAIVLVLTCCILIILLVLRSSALDRISHQWQWGSGLIAVRDTPYNNLALLKDESLFSLFGNGLWFFSIPDVKTAEHAVHLALLQHPHPRTVLLVGGGIVTMVPEILKHPGIIRLDVVEPDSEIINLMEMYLPKGATAALKDHRVHHYRQDAGLFVRQTDKNYDVILSTLGDPLNAELNRYYTVEYFEKISRLLNPGGVFSFAVSASEILGPVQLRLLKSMLDTTNYVFPQVLLLLVDSARFFACNGHGQLITDASALQARILERKLDLQYVQEYYLTDYLNPMRLDYVNKLLSESSSQRLNKDFSPLCYFNNLLLWAHQLNPTLEKTLITIVEIKKWHLWSAITIVLILFALLSWRGCLGLSVLLNMSVMAMGGTQLALEIILLLSFQILTGFVYKQLALIVTLFMAGVALGAGMLSLLTALDRVSRRWLIGVQAVFGVYLLAVLTAIMMMHGSTGGKADFLLAPFVFPAMACLGGLFGGLHFALAVKMVSGSAAASAAVAGRLYAIDLFGAVIGSVATSLYLIPAYGVTTTMFILCALNMGTALMVGAAPR